MPPGALQLLLRSHNARLPYLTHTHVASPNSHFKMWQRPHLTILSIKLLLAHWMGGWMIWLAIKTKVEGFIHQVKNYRNWASPDLLRPTWAIYPKFRPQTEIYFIGWSLVIQRRQLWCHIVDEHIWALSGSSGGGEGSPGLVLWCIHPAARNSCS